MARSNVADCAADYDKILGRLSGSCCNVDAVKSTAGQASSGTREVKSTAGRVRHGGFPTSSGIRDYCRA
jgi:hypothetical protein